MRPTFFVLALIAAIALTNTCAGAVARPVVTLKLTVANVQTDANGKDVLTPSAGKVVHGGDRLRYEIIASNTGDRAATQVRPYDMIPAGTEFIAHSATGNGKVEYALDGKTWSAVPLVVVHTNDGDKTIPADPATYKAIRWTTTLAPGASSAFGFDVRVK